MMSFDDTLTRANFSFVYFLQFYLLKFFLTFFNGRGLNPQTLPLAMPLGELVSLFHHTEDGLKVLASTFRSNSVV